MTEIQWTTAEREAVAAQVPTGPLHDHGCRCHGDGDPAATDQSLGVFDGHWYDPYCVAYARRARGRHREAVTKALDALAPLVAAREAQAAAKALHQVADDLASITHGRLSEGIKDWPHHDQNVYELAIEEASVKIHDRADQIEQAKP